jgi:hypothetical protein
VWSGDKRREGAGPKEGFSGNEGRDIPEKRGSLEKLSWGEGETVTGERLEAGSELKVDGRGLGAQREG